MIAAADASVNSFARTQIPVPDNLPGPSRSKNVYARYISKPNHNRLSLPMCRHSPHSDCRGGSETGVDDATYGGDSNLRQSGYSVF